MDTHKMIVAGLVLVTAILLFGGAWLFSQAQKSSAEPGAVLSQNGLHWHPTLAIYVRDELVELPKGMGLGAVHKPVHTHDDTPIIHLEFGGLVREEDVMLGEFFKNWGKDMGSFGTNMHMTVNGKENTEYGRYIMRDGDKIELRYE